MTIKKTLNYKTPHSTALIYSTLLRYSTQHAPLVWVTSLNRSTPACPKAHWVKPVAKSSLPTKPAAPARVR